MHTFSTQPSHTHHAHPLHATHSLASAGKGSMFVVTKGALLIEGVTLQHGVSVHSIVCTTKGLCTVCLLLGVSTYAWWCGDGGYDGGAGCVGAPLLQNATVRTLQRVQRHAHAYRGWMKHREGGGACMVERVLVESVWRGAVGVMSEPTTQPFSLCFMLTFCCFPTLSACVPL
jgi:hypothetical protein